MKYRLLGSTGYKVSEVALGCWQLGGDFGDITDTRTTAILASANANGMNFFDTADVYGNGLSEDQVGQFVTQHNHDIIVATKMGRAAHIFPDNYTKSALRESIEKSLLRLRLKRLPLIQLHCIPPLILREPRIFDWLESFKSEGLIKEYGASVESLEEAQFCLAHSDVTTLQIIFNIFRQDAAIEILPEAKRKNVGIIARLPLASGLLTGKFKSQHQFQQGDHRHFNRDGQHFHVGETFNGIPFETGVSLVNELKQRLKGKTELALTEVAIRWLLDHSAVSTAIIGASSAQQVERNAQISALPPLNEETHDIIRDFYFERVRQEIRGAI